MHHHPIRTALAAATLAMCAGANAQTSNFDLGAEGWRAIGDPASSVRWSATGGYIYVEDAGFGDVIYFVAPSAFLGDKSSAIGGSLSFDVKQDIAGGSQFGSDDVRLSGGGLTIAYDTAPITDPSRWESYSVPLTAVGWHLNTIAGPAVTETQFANVLSNLTGLAIRVEYWTNTPEIDYLDNVQLAPVPETSRALMMLLGIGALFCVTQSRQRAK